VTDTPVGRRFCNEKLGVAAFNALREGRELANCVLKGLAARRASRRTRLKAPMREHGVVP
jgi:hypothetical protein